MGRASPCAITIPGILAAFAAIAIVTAPAAGAASGCRAPTSHPFPSAMNLRASHTDCNTARAVVAHIQAVWQVDYTFPGWFRAPAGGSKWHCRYQRRAGGHSHYTEARCASGQKLVTVNLGA